MINRIIGMIPVILVFLLPVKVKGQRVVLDYYFNHETKTTAAGNQVRYHYLWTDTAQTGFSKWGEEFQRLGCRLDSLDQFPALNRLQNADIYIIVDPDSRKENAHPNFMTPLLARNIAAWVKKGGVLVLMANDSANVDLPHFNILAGQFGLHFNDDLQNHVTDDNHFVDGRITFNNHPIFKSTKVAFLKDVCSISMKGRGWPVVTSPNGAAIAVVVKYGKGTVFAVGDPWLYNEYVNGRLPEGYENDKAMVDLSKWLVGRSKRQ